MSIDGNDATQGGGVYSQNATINGADYSGDADDNIFNNTPDQVVIVP